MLAEHQGRLLGRGTLVRSLLHRDSCYVDIFIERGARRNGVGRAIFEALLDRAAEQHVLLGRVMPSQPSRLPFAEALGFSVLMRCPVTPAGSEVNRYRSLDRRHPAPAGVTVMSAGERPFDEVLDAWTDYFVWIHERWSPTYSWDTVRSVFAGSGLAEVDFELSRVAVRGDAIVALACVLLNQWDNRWFMITETVRRATPNARAVVGAVTAAALRACAGRGIAFVEFDGHEVDPHYYPLSQTLPVTGTDPLFVLEHPGRSARGAERMLSSSGRAQSAEGLS